MSFSPDTLEKVADIARDLLNERFGNDLVFDPVFAKSLVDHYGDDYIQLYPVFDAARNTCARTRRWTGPSAWVD